MEKILSRSGTKNNLENLQPAKAIITGTKPGIAGCPNEVYITYSQTGINSCLFTPDSISKIKKDMKAIAYTDKSSGLCALKITQHKTYKFKSLK